MISYSCPDRSRNETGAQESRLERMLRVALFRRSCPDTMVLSDYQLGFLSPTERARVHAHVARCPHCQAELARLGTFLADRPAVSSWISDLGFEWRRLMRAGGEASQIVIRLVKDTLMPLPQLLPVRGEDNGADFGVQRQIALHPEQTGGLDVQVEVRRSLEFEEACQVIAQVQSPERWPDLAGATVKVQAGAWSREAQTDEHGRVVVEGVPSALLDVMTIKVDSM